MAKYATFSPLFQNSNLGTASRNFQNTMFGGGGGGASELDPSQIWANEQLAVKRKAEASLKQQQYQAWNQAMQDPNFNPMMFNSNILQGRKAERTQAGTNQIADILANPNTTDEQRAQAIYSGYLGETMPAGGFYSGTREDQFARDQQRLLDQNAANNARAIDTNRADNARAIDTNRADNARALDQTGLTAENNILKALLAPVPAGAQRFNPPGVVEEHGVDAIQATPAKPTTGGSRASSKGWVEGQSPMQVKNIQANWFNTGYRKKNPKFDGVENLPSGFLDNMMQDVYDVVQSGEMTVANATNAEMEKMFSDGFHQFQYDPPGMFNLNAFGVVPKKLFDFYVKEYGRKKREGKGDEGLSEIEDVFINLGYSEEEIAVILSDIQSQ